MNALSMKTLSFEIKDDILIVEFKNSSRANCFGENEGAQLNELLNKKVRGLIFHSLHSKIFCSGGNLADYAALKTKSSGKKINYKIRNTLQKLFTINYPTVCLVTGDCLGGGVELISAFDKIYANSSCFFGLWQRRLGLTFGWGGFDRLKKRIPQHTLRQLTLETRLISAFEAESLNLIDEIVPRALLLPKALDWVDRQKLLPQEIVAPIKALTTKTETKIFDSLWMGPDHKNILKKIKK